MVRWRHGEKIDPRSAGPEETLEIVAPDFLRSAPWRPEGDSKRWQLLPSDWNVISASKWLDFTLGGYIWQITTHSLCITFWNTLKGTLQLMKDCILPAKKWLQLLPCDWKVVSHIKYIKIKINLKSDHRVKSSLTHIRKKLILVRSVYGDLFYIKFQRHCNQKFKPLNFIVNKCGSNSFWMETELWHRRKR